MVDVETPPAEAPDKTTRSAALVAAAIALPIALVVGLLMFWRLAPHTTTAKPGTTATTQQTVPSTPVQMAAPALTAHAATVCRAVTSRLPAKIRNLPARKVSAGPEQNAAYGEPPITVSCGIPQPRMCETVTPGQTGCVPLDADLLVMNGVCWYGDDGPATKLFTTMDRDVAVQVGVPASYDQPGQWANEFSDVVARSVGSRTTSVPTGCG
jgi:Protein of unknown function (DUF3515)